MTWNMRKTNDAYEPDEATIQAEAAKIRATWDDKVLRKRAVESVEALEFPVVDTWCARHGGGD